jgi:hypothetical protein
LGEVVDGQRLLPEMARALYFSSRFPNQVDRRQQQRHEDADHGDHHQEFDEGKTVV